jgi:hypothetical protein
LPCAHAVAVRHPSLPCGNPLPCGVVRCRAHPFAVRKRSFAVRWSLCHAQRHLCRAVNPLPCTKGPLPHGKDFFLFYHFNFQQHSFLFLN